VSRRPRWQLSLREGVGARVVRESGPIDVHVVTHERAGQGTLPQRAEVLSRNRRMLAWVVALLGPIALTGALVALREIHELPIDIMTFLSLTVGVALIGGLWPAVTVAVFGSLLLNWFLTPPYYEWTIADPQNAFALLVFVLVAVGVASVVDLAARRTIQAARAGAEAETLSALAGSVLRGENTVLAILERLRERFGMESVTLLERHDPHELWTTVECAGGRPCASPEEGSSEVMISDTLALALRGPVLEGGDRRVLEAFAAQATVVLERERLREQAQEARRLEEGDAIRTALLAAVSHDLRTPLAAIKAGVTSLSQDEVVFDPGDQAELLATVGQATDSLERLIDNLLDLSRLETDTVRPVTRPAALDEVVPRAVSSVPAESVQLDVPESLPLLTTDAGLLERALANIVENAVRYSPAGVPVTVSAAVVRSEVEIRVTDRGPGVNEADKGSMFRPFQRLGDGGSGSGAGAGGSVGLGLAVARGFVEALGGTLTADDTPGGGLTMVLRLPLSAGAA
jgi:two-component system sensor histidine kinase KdpD